MRYFISQHIHSCFASWSSSDIWLYKEINRAEFKVMAEDRRTTISKKYGFSVVYAESDNKYGGTAYITNRIPEDVLNAYVWETYQKKGYRPTDTFLTDVLHKHWADEERANVEKRIKEGYVIPEWQPGLPPQSYQGGFSKDVFYEPALFNYVSHRVCHGYIGHSVRKPALDAYFEKAFLKVNPDKSLLAMWLTSTGGRHYCDSLEGYSFVEQKKKIRESIEGVVEQALYYREKDKVANTLPNPTLGSGEAAGG